MTPTEHQIEQALIECFEALRPTKPLPELWSMTFPVCLRSVARMNQHHIQAWFHGFSPAAKLGMWWSYSTDKITLHSSTGEKPHVNSLADLILWLDSLEVAEPGKISCKNLTLLTRATEAYSY